MVNSIVKGKNWEREIANYLSEELGVKFLRVPMSGGFATIHKSEDPRFDGDVFTEDEYFKDLVIECKSYTKLEITELFNLKSKFYGWIKQAETESRDKDWLLFIKIKNKGGYMLSNKMLPVFTKLKKDKLMIMVNKYLMVKLK